MHMSLDGVSGAGAEVGQSGLGTGASGEGGGGVIVGAEGAFPVEIGFIEGWDRDGRLDVENGSERTEDGSNEAEGGDGNVYISTRRRAVLGEVEDVPDNAAAVAAAGQRSGDEGTATSVSVDRASVGDADQVSESGGLESWAADFGLFVAPDEQQGGGRYAQGGQGSGVFFSEFVPGLEFVQKQEDKKDADAVSPRTKENVGNVEEMDRFFRKDAPAGVDEVLHSQPQAFGAGFVDGREEASSEAGLGEGRRSTTVLSEDKGGRLPNDSVKAEAAPTSKRGVAIGTALRTDEADRKSLTGSGKRDVEVGDDAASVNAAISSESNPDAPRMSGLFEILKRSRRGTDDSNKGRSRRKAADHLNTAVRTAGGELYGLGDRLAVISTTVEGRPLMSAGRGRQRLATAEAAVASVRDLITTVGSSKNKVVKELKSAEIRRALQAAKRCVREAERVVEADVALLDAAEARRADALAELSVCHRKFRGARTRFRDSAADLDESTADALSPVLGEAQEALDVATDCLRQPLSTMPSRKRGKDRPGSADELVVKTCKTSVDNFVATVDKMLSERTVEDDSRKAGGDVVSPRRRPGERLVMQARALREAMLGPAGVNGKIRRGDEEEGRAFRAALARLDAALAEADRVKFDTVDGNDDDNAFTKAAQDASRAAQELEKAAENGANEAGARADGAKKLVRLALVEVGELEADVKESGFENEHSVTPALRLARRDVEKVAHELGSQGGAGGVDIPERIVNRKENRVQALVANGTLEAALGKVDKARVEVARVRKLADLEEKAKTALAQAASRVDALSREAATGDIPRRPAVARALQGCRSALTVAQRYDTRSRSLHLDEREELARDLLAAAQTVAEARQNAEEVLVFERDAAFRNDQQKVQLEARLEPAQATVLRLRERLKHVSDAATARHTSLEKSRSTAACWNTGAFVDDGVFPLRASSPQEPNGATATRAVAESTDSIEAMLAKIKEAWDVGTLNEEIEVCLKGIAVAEAAVASAEARGQRRDHALAGLERVVVKVQSVIDDALATRINARPAVAESLAAALTELRAAFNAATDTARSPDPAAAGPRDDIGLLDVVERAEGSAETAMNVLARERLVVEQAERDRQDTASELRSASRQLEGLDTSGVVGDDPEAVAMVLEARSEVVQALVALEAAEDSTDHVGAAQEALKHALNAEEAFAESQRIVRCFDDSAFVLEQAEARVEEAQYAMRVGTITAAGRAAFQKSLERYEDALDVAASSEGGADKFQEACNRAFSAAREVEVAATKARRQVRARTERRRRELARLDRPAAALVALDLSELTDARGEAPRRAVAAVRDALSAINVARREVAEGHPDEDGSAEVASGDRVDRAVQVAASAERAFRAARDRGRKAERWRLDLVRPQATLAGVKAEAMAMPDAKLVFELCSSSIRKAEATLESAREAVEAIAGGTGATGDAEALVKTSRVKVNAAQRDTLKQITRVNGAASKRNTQRSALACSADALARVESALDADDEVRSLKDSIGEIIAKTGDVTRDVLSEALRACSAAEQAVNTARSLLDQPLTSSWLNAETDGGVESRAEVEERAVENAQLATARAEGTVASLTERLGHLRGIRAKLTALLAAAEGRFRRASAILTDSGASPSASEMNEVVEVARVALTRARERLKSPLGTGHLVAGAGKYYAGEGGGSGGGLARDEEVVSDAAGYVTALESFAASARHAMLQEQNVSTGREWMRRTTLVEDDTPSIERARAPLPAGSSVGGSETTAKEALTLALQWGDALRAQVMDFRLGGEPAVSEALKAAEKSMAFAKERWVASGNPASAETSATEGRKALEALATDLGRLENVTETAAEQRRTREAGIGAAAKRLDRLTSTLGVLRETVHAAGEPLVLLTAEAMQRATEAVAAASHAAAAAAGVEGAQPASSRVQNASRGPSPLFVESSRTAAFSSAVQTAAVAVVQAEATVNRARERASQVSVERVRALETLVGLAEALSTAGDRLASSSTERGLSSSREAAAAISEAKDALSRARAAAQADIGAWLSGTAAIAEAVATARELVRRAERVAHGPAVVSPTTARRDDSKEPSSNDSAVAEAEAKACAWLDAGGEGERKSFSPSDAATVAQKSPEVEPADTRKRKDARRARIGFSDRGEGAPTYMPLWMRLQKKAWELGGSVVAGTGNGGGKMEAEPGISQEEVVGLPAPATAVRPKSSSADSAVSSLESDFYSKRRREEEERLRAEADRLRAEASRLRQAHAARSSNPKSGRQGRGAGRGRGGETSDAAGGNEPRNFKQTAEDLAEDMVKEFAARAKSEAQRIAAERRLKSSENDQNSPL